MSDSELQSDTRDASDTGTRQYEWLRNGYFWKWTAAVIVLVATTGGAVFAIAWMAGRDDWSARVEWTYSVIVGIGALVGLGFASTLARLAYRHREIETYEYETLSAQLTAVSEKITKLSEAHAEQRAALSAHTDELIETHTKRTNELIETHTKRTNELIDTHTKQTNELIETHTNHIVALRNEGLPAKGD